MEKNKISIEQVREAFRQADANMNFEEVIIKEEKTKTKTKELKYANRPLGRLSDSWYQHSQK